MHAARAVGIGNARPGLDELYARTYYTNTKKYGTHHVIVGALFECSGTSHRAGVDDALAVMMCWQWQCAGGGERHLAVLQTCCGCRRRAAALSTEKVPGWSEVNV